jgi:hypothetical protein
LHRSGRSAIVEQRRDHRIQFIPTRSDLLFFLHNPRSCMLTTTASPVRRCVYALVVATGVAFLASSCGDHLPLSPTSSDEASLASLPPTARNPLQGSIGADWVWVLRIAGGRYAQHVQLIQFLGPDRPRAVLRLRVLPSRDWQGESVTDLPIATQMVRAGVRGELQAALLLTDGTTARLTLRVRDERGLGQWSEHLPNGDSASYRVMAFRVPTAVLPPDQSKLTRIPNDDSIPVVLLRVDDNMPSDRDFAARLIARQLPAEFAIPTLSPSNSNRPAWEELQAWSRRGIAMVAHSRRHSAETAGDLDFMEEVLGSLTDLHSHGLATNVFVQPGSWRDSLYFDTPQKVETWRGALLRTASLVSECYDSPGTIYSPPGETAALCYSHVTISDALTPAQILAAWKDATKLHRFTTFLVHSYRMPSPGFLDFFLDTLSSARATGRIRLVQESVDAFFERGTARTACKPETLHGIRVTDVDPESGPLDGTATCPVTP